MTIRALSIVAFLVAGSPLTIAELARSQNCFIEINVYDAKAAQLPFSITGVSIKEGTKSVDALSLFHFTPRANRIYFPRLTSWPSRAFDVALADPTGKVVHQEVTLYSCHGRASIQYGSSDIGDIAGSRLKGRIIGCPTYGDWWIRAFPVFGHGESPEGYVEPDTGMFSVVVLSGVPHMAVIGKGKVPLKILATDVTIGIDKDLGNVDLTGLCPR